ncbi:hypothetical protein KOW79_013585 [Hemibagrus wyckioides]|uniref:Uncharacterized protein n=1 Tax=Hemibagrus wyckioides TaxID=337641 RepID=A0A9D3NH03_9TELE|nr:hypothetical protein KOW79_013585 [Hemibagrus wyckioides]
MILFMNNVVERFKESNLFPIDVGAVFMAQPQQKYTLVYRQRVLGTGICLPNTFRRLLSDASRQPSLTKGHSSASAVAFRPQATHSSLWVTCIRQMSQMQGRGDPTTGGREEDLPGVAQIAQACLVILFDSLLV